MSILRSSKETVASRVGTRSGCNPGERPRGTCSDGAVEAKRP
jgi:hypothetical protein